MTNNAVQISAKSEKQLKKNQTAYILEAAFEYFIDIMIKTTFITALLMHLGVSQGDAGIITSLASLGFTAQFFSVMFINPKNHIKKLSSVLHLINQMLFVVMYLVPGIQIPGAVKIAIVAGLYLCGNLLHYTIFPFKFDWMMSYVPDKKRGVFTANKEIVSLLGGIIFSNTMGVFVEGYIKDGKAETAFVLSAITIFVLCILHLITILVIKDPEDYVSVYTENQKKRSIKEILGITLFDKKLNKVILLDILWHIGTGISTAFFSIYAQQSMEIAIVTITVITAASSLLRVLVSKFFGRMADKYSWAKMMSVSFLIGAVSFLIFAFANPGNCFNLNIFGTTIKLNIFHVLYTLLHAVSTAGTNSGMTNITFDYVSHENRRFALGIKSAIGGLVAFLATFAVRFFVNAYSEGVFTLFGINIYAQQILSFGTALIFLFIVMYIKKVIMKLKIVED